MGYNQAENPRVAIVGFPYFFAVPPSQGDEIAEDDEVRGYSIWIQKDAHLDNEAINRRLMPNENGKVSMKSEDGSIKIFYYKDVLVEVLKAVDRGVAIAKHRDAERKKRMDEERSDLDPKLVESRLVLKIEFDKLFKSVKDAKSMEAALAYKEKYYEAQSALEKFDFDNPGYGKTKDLRKQTKVPAEQRSLEYMKAKAELALKMTAMVDAKKLYELAKIEYFETFKNEPFTRLFL